METEALIFIERIVTVLVFHEFLEILLINVGFFKR